jgi:HPt (histidine-containing phosphotransfer) domain-containing protein
MSGDRERCLAAGTDDYLSKPIIIESLASILDKWLPKKGGWTPRSDIQKYNSENSHVDGLLEQVIDQRVLAGIRAMEDEDDPDMLSDIIRLYLEQAPELLNTIEIAIENSHSEGVRIAAHTLKGSSANMGAKLVTELCTELEELGRAGKFDTARSRFSQLIVNYQAARETLTLELKERAL